MSTHSTIGNTSNSRDARVFEITAAAAHLGCHADHLRRVLTGRVRSPALFRRYFEFKNSGHALKRSSAALVAEVGQLEATVTGMATERARVESSVHELNGATAVIASDLAALRELFLSSHS